MAAHLLWHSNQDELAKEKDRQEGSTIATLRQDKRVHSGTTFVLHTSERSYSASKKDNLRRHQIRKHILLSQDENTKELEIEPIKQEGEL